MDRFRPHHKQIAETRVPVSFEVFLMNGRTLVWLFLSVVALVSADGVSLFFSFEHGKGQELEDGEVTPTVKIDAQPNRLALINTERKATVNVLLPSGESDILEYNGYDGFMVLVIRDSILVHPDLNAMGLFDRPGYQDEITLPFERSVISQRVAVQPNDLVILALLHRQSPSAKMDIYGVVEQLLDVSANNLDELLGQLNQSVQWGKATFFGSFLRIYAKVPKPLAHLSAKKPKLALPDGAKDNYYAYCVAIENAKSIECSSSKPASLVDPKSLRINHVFAEDPGQTDAVSTVKSLELSNHVQESKNDYHPSVWFDLTDTGKLKIETVDGGIALVIRKGTLINKVDQLSDKIIAGRVPRCKETVEVRKDDIIVSITPRTHLAASRSEKKEFFIGGWDMAGDDLEEILDYSQSLVNMGPGWDLDVVISVVVT